MIPTLPITVTSNLSEVYADISEELFNKHAKLLSELKNRFADLYDGSPFPIQISNQRSM